MSKLTKILERSGIIGKSRILFNKEKPQMFLFLRKFNRRSPFSFLLMPGNSFVSTATAATNALIAMILRATTFAEIIFAVVERVVVPVVTLFDHIAPKNKCMHRDDLPVVWQTPVSVKTVCESTPFSIPIPLIQPLEVLGIDDRVLPLCQRNQTVGLVKRLSHCMAFHAAFHRSSWKGPLFLSRYFSMEAAPCG